MVNWTSGFSDPHIKVLLDILNANISGYNRPPANAEYINEFSTLIALSGKHGTDTYVYLFFQQNPHLISPAQLCLTREMIKRQAVKSLRQLHELISICSNFDKRSVKYSVIKGPHLTRLLNGKKTVKVSADLDILMVNPGDLMDFHRVLTGMGYHCAEPEIMAGKWWKRLFFMGKREAHYYCQASECSVDLHVRPFANTIITRRLYGNFFSDLTRVAFEGITIPVLPDEKYFIYLCHHAACHQFSRLAWLLDIRNFYRMKQDKIDVGKILAIAKSLNMTRSLYLAFYMMKIIFNAEIPAEIDSSTGKSRILGKLAKNSLKVLTYGKKEDLKWRARFDRMIYLIRLNTSIAGKADVLLSIILRRLVSR
jgi:hypothetical protein